MLSVRRFAVWKPAEPPTAFLLSAEIRAQVYTYRISAGRSTAPGALPNIGLPMCRQNGPIDRAEVCIPVARPSRSRLRSTC